MVIVKPYAELTHAEKLLLLHALFPQDIKAFLIFLAERIEKLLLKPDHIMMDWNIKDGPSWPDLLHSLAEHIGQSFDELVVNKEHFVNTFSKGHNQFFFLDSIQVYSTLCSNETFRKAIEFLFDF